MPLSRGGHRRHRARRGGWRAAALAAALAAVAGCTGDEESGSRTIIPPPPVGPLDCTLLVGATSVIHLQEITAPDGQCGVELVTGDTAFIDAFGVAFHLVVPAQLAFEAAEDTGGLAPDAAATTFEVIDIGGEVFVGYARLVAGGVTLAPGTPLFRVFFRATQVGAGALTFTQNELRSSTNVTLSPPPAWQGATAQIVLAP